MSDGVGEHNPGMRLMVGAQPWNAADGLEGAQPRDASDGGSTTLGCS